MKKIIFTCFLLIAVLVSSTLKAQTIPVGSCGIVYTYDAAGNRTKREYICVTNLVAEKEYTVDKQKIAAKDIIKVNVLYPNPTTGFFSVKLTAPLNEAIVTISDVSGKTVLKRTESGSILNYDLSQQASGEYLVTIKQNQNVISMKVIKRN